MKLPPFLTGMLEKGQVPHALIFTGAGRNEAAEGFALALLGINKSFSPDLHRYYPEGKSGLHSIAQIRSLIEDVAFFPYAGKWKVFLIYEADRMLPTGSNALLKTLEEPTPHTLILLLTAHFEALLPTIRSRCQMFSFAAAPQKRKASQDLLLKLLSSPQKKDFLFLKDSLEAICKEAEEKEGHEEGILLLRTALEWGRDLIAVASGSASLIHPDCRPLYESYLHSCPLPNLFHLEKKAEQAKTSLERSTKLSTCLETLLLSIN